MFRRFYLFACLLTAPFQLQAQDLSEICQTLAKSGLVDTRNSSIVTSNMGAEFDRVCKAEGNRKETYDSSTTKFKANFSGFGANAGARGGLNNESSLSEARISSMCDEGRSNFESYVEARSFESVGGTLANYVVECVAAIRDRNVEAVWGTTSTAADDTGFNVTVYFSQGEAAYDYELVRITAPVSCWADKSSDEVGATSLPAVKNIVMSGNSENAFYCDKEVGKEQSGSFVFEANIGGNRKRHQEIAFDVPSVNQKRENALALLREVDKALDEVRTELRREFREDMVGLEASINHLELSLSNLAAHVGRNETRLNEQEARINWLYENWATKADQDLIEYFRYALVFHVSDCPPGWTDIGGGLLSVNNASATKYKDYLVFGGDAPGPHQWTHPKICLRL